MQFAITKNTLSKSADIKVLQLENEHYTIKLFYMGDYTNDYKHHTIDTSSIRFVCKPKNNNLSITYHKNCLYVDLTYENITYLDTNKIASLKSKLDIADNSRMELIKYFHHYFLQNMQ